MKGNSPAPDMLRAALDLAENGWRVHPVRSNKKAFLLGWPQLATTDPETIQAWWGGQYRDALIGIATGPGSGFFAIDVDNGPEGEASLKQLVTEYGPLPKSIEVATPNEGRHIYGRYPKGANIRNTTRLCKLAGVDVRGDGGYVIAPPSALADGLVYRWTGDPTPDLLPAEFPATWLALLESPQNAELTQASDDSSPNKKLSRATLEFIADGAPRGSRNELLFKAACDLHGCGYSEKEAFDRVEASAIRSGLDRKEVVATVKSAFTQDRAPSIPAAVEPWETPIPLLSFNPSPFPIEAIPRPLEGLRRFIEAVAESLQVPVDMPAMLALAVGGASLAKRIDVHVQGDHIEPVNLFVAVVMESANRKSSTFRAITQPLYDFEHDESERLAELIHQNRSDRAILEQRLKHAQRKASTSEKPDDRKKHHAEATKLAAELGNFPTLCDPQLVADDATPESVAELMDLHGGRMAIMSPEGGVFGMMSGRYDKNGKPNLDVYLKGHAGDDIRVNRVNKDRRPAFIRKPALTHGLTIQPEVVAGLHQRELRGRGLLARFLYSMPASLLGSRKTTTRPIPQDLRAQYHRIIRRACEFHPARDGQLRNVPHEITFGVPALNAWLGLACTIEAGLSERGQFAALRDWAGKLPGAAARIAGILHGLTCAAKGSAITPEIDEETALCAIAIAEYLIDHARGAFRLMGADPAVELAKRVLSWIEDRNLLRFTRRDAFKALEGTLPTVALIDAPLQVLHDHGYIRPIHAYRYGPGRKPSPAYEVNPKLHGQNRHNRQNQVGTQQSGDSGDSVEGAA